MQILDIPHTHDAMHCSLSITGATILKLNQYRSRHGGPKNYVQLPRTGFVLKSQTAEHIAKLELNRKKKLRKKIWEPGIKPKVKREPAYKINKKEISHRIQNFVNQQQGRKLLFFWTVTFMEGLPDDTAFILMNKWLTRLRKEKMIGSYLWITERQKNNTIHFHIAIHKHMNVQKANKFMRASIMHCINDGSIVYDRILAMRYNGVHISKDQKTKKVVNFALKKKGKALIRYITKYVTKNTEEFKHLAWHCSRDYSNLIIAVRLTESEFQKVIKANILDEVVCFDGEYYEFYRWKAGAPPDLLRYLATANNNLLSLLDTSNLN